MPCPYCGADSIVYDFAHGYTVCTSCGTVLDTIYLEFFNHVEHSRVEEVGGVLSVREGIVRKEERIKMRYLAKLYRDVEIYESYAKRARKSVRVDWDMLQKKLSGEKVRVYRHESEKDLEKLVAGDTLLHSIVENVVNKDPILSSRTLRGKIAIAMVLKHMMTKGYVDYDEIARATHMNRVHIRRLVRLVNDRYKNSLSINKALAISA